MKRSPMPPRKRRMRARSARMSRLYEVRREIVARLLAERPQCEARIEGVCSGRSEDVHEVLRRSAGGSIVDEANLRAVCRRCHDAIHRNPKAAMERGLLVSRYAG